MNMKKILFTRQLIRTSEEYASNLFKVKFNVGGAATDSMFKILYIRK